MENGMLETRAEKLNIKFYGAWYEDLHQLGNAQLEAHWLDHGFNEGRAPNPIALSQRMFWPISDQEWGVALETIKSDKAETRSRLIQFVQAKLIGVSRSERNQRLTSVDFDIAFYKSWYPDLVNLSDEQLEKHWHENGRNKDRFGSFRSMVEAEGIEADELPVGFNEVGYIELNDQVARLRESNLYKLAYHYLIIGKSRGYSYYFDPFFYKAFYDDISSSQKATDLLEHFKKFGPKEKRHPNLEIYLESKSGRSLMAHFNSKFSVNEILGWNPHLQEVDLTQIISRVIKSAGAERTRLFELDINNATFYSDYGIILMNSGDPVNALKAFHTSLSFHPVVASFEYLGLLYGQQEKRELAHEFLKEALKRGSKRIDVIDSYLASSHGQTDFQEISEVVQSSPTYKAMDQIRIVAQRLWEKVNAENKVLATKNERSKIQANTAEYAQKVREQFSNYYRRFSMDHEIKTHLNLKRVLLIGDEFIPQCIRYRIEQKESQLKKAGMAVERIAWNESNENLLDSLLRSDIIIFYRCPAFPGLLHIVEKAKLLGKLCIYEIDDLIFSSEFPPPIQTYGALIDSDHYTELVRSFWLYAEMAKACHFALGSTQTISDQLANLVSFKRGIVHRNALDAHSLIRSKTHSNNKSTIDLFYGSATLAHNSDFTENLLPVLIDLLSKYQNVRLVIVGHLALGNLMSERLIHRVKMLPYISDTGTYLEVLGQSDINLAVLERSQITDAKSEIKWMEAGALGIPSVVSATANYFDVIQDGQTGFIAETKDQWATKLSALIESSELRNQIGAQAKEYILKNYSEEVMSKKIHETIMNFVSEFEQATHE